jgi:aminoglycoside phosphotransferase (APT) family kinase protein
MVVTDPALVQIPPALAALVAACAPVPEMAEITTSAKALARVFFIMERS